MNYSAVADHVPRESPLLNHPCKYVYSARYWQLYLHIAKAPDNVNCLCIHSLAWQLGKPLLFHGELKCTLLVVESFRLYPSNTWVI